MQTELLLHDRPVRSIFELLGVKENHITYSIGWALARSPALRTALLKRLFPGSRLNVRSVSLQSYSSERGITDVELRGDDVHVIIEAKRGLSLPSLNQLLLYCPRLSKCPHRALVTMSECTPSYAALRLPASVRKVPVFHFGWRDVEQMAKAPAQKHAEKRLLAELRLYLERVMPIQNQESNLVYVVVLKNDTPSWSTLSWRDMVIQKRRYFHPVGVRGWPKEPPNYVGFRYDGRLQHIHHIESWKIITDINSEMPELRPDVWDQPNFVYTLGPPIVPAKTVRNGRIYANGRYRVMLDLLLTCDTISQARDLTKERRKGVTDGDSESEE